MEYRRLPGKQIAFSEIGFGCWAIGGHGYGITDDRESVAAVHAALGEGVTLFDTADVYGFGHSETILGQALGERRNDVVIATKGGIRWDEQRRTTKDCSPKYLRSAVENSLRRLGVHQIPLYQLHWHDGKTPISDSFGEMQRLKSEGKIEHVGTSNVDFEFIREASKATKILTHQAKFGYLDTENEDLMRQLHDELDIGILCYGALARGLLTGKYSDKSSFGANDTRASDPKFGSDYSAVAPCIEKLRRDAEINSCSPGQMALRWALENPNVTSVIVGMKTADQVRGNCAASLAPQQ